MNRQNLRITIGKNGIPGGERLRRHTENALRMGLNMGGQSVRISMGKTNFQEGICLVDAL